MEPQAYAKVIVARLSDPRQGDYEAFASLAHAYHQLAPFEQINMRAGLIAAMSEINDPGALADAIHLAYHLELFDQDMVNAIADQAHHGPDDPRVAREIANYRAHESCFAPAHA